MTDFRVDIKDGINVKDKIGMDAGPTKEQLETVEKQLVLFLLDLKKTLQGATDIVNKIGFTHLGNSLHCSVRDIDIYLQEYEKGKKNAK